MNRLCGWVGFDVSDDRRRTVLEAMTGASESALRSQGAFWLAPGCALGAVPGATSVDVHGENDDLWVAVEGPVRFGDAALADAARGRGPAAALAAGYREHGWRVLERTRDAFALVIIRPDAGEACLAIDRIGGRHPLTYRVANGTLVFGSDAGVVQRHPRGASPIDPQALFNYLYFEVVPGPGTARRDIRRLMPGECLTFSSGAIQLRRYWQIRYRERERVSVDELEVELHRVLRESVQRDATQSVGCFLSGGTDSSAVAGVLGEVTGRPARAYSIGFDATGYDEMRYARIAARHFGAELREYYVRPVDVVEAVPKIAAAHAEPFGNASAVPAYYCAKMAREDGVTRLLGGDGGDELFAGNERYRRQHVLGLYDKLPELVRRIVEPLTERFPLADEVVPLRKVRSYVRQARLPMPQRMQVYNYLERTGTARIFEPAFLEGVDPTQPLALLSDTYWSAQADSMLNRMLALDQRFALADNDLPKVSRSCALAGLEVTYPLLSDAMVELSTRVPPRLNLRFGKLRWFWKHALRDYLPREVLTKTKQGFGLPFGIWLRDDAQLRELARESLTSLRRRSIVRPEYVDEVLRLHETEHATYYGVMIWLLVMLEQWFQAHVDGAAVG